MPLSFNILIEVDIICLGLQTIFVCNIWTYYLFIFCNFRSVSLFCFVAKSSLFSLEYFIFASRSIFAIATSRAFQADFGKTPPKHIHYRMLEFYF